MRVKSPFFATLALFAQFEPCLEIPTAATDGKSIFYNPNYLTSLPTAQQDGLILQEILHAALLHTIRRQHRESRLWNIAADIVVNGLIAEDKNYELPAGELRQPDWERKSVEETINCCNLHQNHSYFSARFAFWRKTSLVESKPETI